MQLQSACGTPIRSRTAAAPALAQEDYVICGWYTPDYQRWYRQLERDLLRHDQPFEFFQRQRPKGVLGWEATTMLKAAEVLAAFERHADKTIVFIDVDCRVRGDLSALTRLRGDVAFYIHPRRRKSGHTKAHVRSGTMVFKPNAGARRFVERWAQLSERPLYGDVDQDSLLLALDTPGVTFEQLDVRWCHTKSDRCDDPVIMHDSASKLQPKISTTRRRFASLLSSLRHRRETTRELPG